MNTDETLDNLIIGMRRQSSMILDNIGIVVKVSEIPEHEEYWSYAFGAPWYLKIFRSIFRRRKLDELHKLSQLAFLNKVLEQGDKIIGGAK